MNTLRLWGECLAIIGSSLTFCGLGAYLIYRAILALIGWPA